MSFDEEWAGLKAAYAPDSTARMRPAGAGRRGGGGVPGPRKKLDVTAGVLRGRAGRTEAVRGRFLKADDEVMRETGQVTGSLKGFRTDAAVAVFQERWRDQMAYVRDQFTGTATALRDAARLFTTEDHGRERDIDALRDGRASGDDRGARP
ncbi:hypothetical protein FM076_26195 [Streptomyces albus subsp. chlorinus]|uniref:type VII secretion target n=1 Tax=Streptomyces albus TaxID=1888 RepID=UPI00156FD243|nr:type VII secretion target [Streptomyces albus]NSC24453.1 hypothetical protein [Streptomyces albus subsp. chlorinus]